MIRNSPILKEFEDAISRQEGPIPPQKAFDIFSAMWQEAVQLGILPFEDPMAGIEIDIKTARILNSCLKSSSAP